MNVYEYGSSNPANEVDPTGLCACARAKVRLLVSALTDVPTLFGLGIAAKGFLYGGRVLRYGQQLASAGRYAQGGAAAMNFGRAWRAGFWPGVWDAVKLSVSGALIDIGTEGALNGVFQETSSAAGLLVDIVVPFAGTAKALAAANEACDWL